MKQRLNTLSRHYVIALRRQLKQGSQASLNPALRLGREAVTLGVETLGLARIHEQALVELELSEAKGALRKVAGIFFTEANAPIEETHHAGRQAKAHLSKVMSALRRRTEELAASLKLQERLRQLTHQVMEAQENERRKISHELEDEVAQTLLGINVRLLSFRSEARRNAKGLKKEIAGTRRLLLNSARSVRQVARKIESL